MARPIKVIPDLEGIDAEIFLKRAEETEKRYFERKKLGSLRDITKDSEHKKIVEKLNNPLIIGIRNEI